MAWNFTSDTPVYLQISDKIKKQILSGEYKLGEQIPTVRNLAVVAAVNPNTVQHAFVQLEKDGIIKSNGTAGRFVTNDQTVVDKCRIQMAQNIVDKFIREMKELSFTQEEAVLMINGKEAEM